MNILVLYLPLQNNDLMYNIRICNMYTFFIMFKKFQKASFHEVPETVNTDTMTQIWAQKKILTSGKNFSNLDHF